MVVSIPFTFLLLYILYSISIEDMNTMKISENKLTLLTILGITYLLCLLELLKMNFCLWTIHAIVPIFLQNFVF